MWDSESVSRMSRGSLELVQNANHCQIQPDLDLMGTDLFVAFEPVGEFFSKLRIVLLDV